MNLHGYRKLLIFGGSFDPPHRGHVELPRLVCRKIDADALVYIPAARSPHKQDAPQASGRDRLAMTRLAVEADPHSLVLATELDRDTDQPSFTVQTLEWLRACVEPEAQMHLLIGADQVPAFPRWHQFQRIIDLAPPRVMLRPPQTRRGLLDQIDNPAQRQAWAERLVDVPPMAISATDIRQRLKADQAITNLVPPAVERYIHDHGLYR